MKLEIQVDRDYTWRRIFYDKGVPLKPESATFAIVDNSGTAIASGDCSVSGTTGEIEFTFAEADNDAIGRNFKLTVTYHTTTDKYFVELFDVCTVAMTNECTEEDLFTELPELRNRIAERALKTTDAGAVNELVCLTLNEDQRDYKGGHVSIMVGDDAEHKARIVDYEQASGSCIFEPAYTSAIAADTNFLVRPSFYNYIEKAFKEVQSAVRNHVGLASLYIDAKVLVNLTTYKALGKFCRGQYEVKDDKWWVRKEDFLKDYQDEFKSLGEPADKDEDGNISAIEDAERPNFNSAVLTR